MEGTAAGWSNLVLDSMGDLRSQAQFTDVALMSNDGVTVDAHSLVLAAGSGHFKDVGFAAPLLLTVVGFELLQFARDTFGTCISYCF